MIATLLAPLVSCCLPTLFHLPFLLALFLFLVLLFFLFLVLLFVMALAWVTLGDPRRSVPEPRTRPRRWLATSFST